MTNWMTISSRMTDTTQVVTYWLKMRLEACTNSSKTKSPLLCSCNTSFLNFGLRFRCCFIHLELLRVF